MATISEKLKLIIEGDSSKAVSELKKLGTEAEKSSAKAKTAGGGLVNTLTGGGGVAGAASVAASAMLALGVSSVKAAVEGEAAHARLQVAIQNVGGETKQYEGKIQAVSEKMAKFGHDNDEVEASIARLIPVTHSVNEAIKLQSTVADIAAGSGKSLADATSDVTAALRGRTRGLAADIGATGDETKALKGLNGIVEITAKHLGGSATAQAQTFTGQLKALKAETHNLEEEFGNLLLPALTNTATGLEFITSGFTHAAKSGGFLGDVIKGGITDIVGGPIGLISGFLSGGKDATDKLAAAEKQLIDDQNAGKPDSQIAADKKAVTEQVRLQTIQTNLLTGAVQDGIDAANGDASAQAASAAAKEKNRVATTGLFGAFNKFQQEITTVKDKQGIVDAFSAVSDAQKKVAGDRADLAGTSDGAVQAEQNVTDAIRGQSDAFRSLDDAQKQVTDSAHSLTEAQKALADFDSARGIRERSLALDIINRRVATTPQEEDQKQLDLLQNQDSNNQKHQQLQDAVTSATKSYAAALQGVQDATLKVGDAERQVTDAEKKRKEFHDAAATAIKADEGDIKKALLGVDQAILQAVSDQSISNSELQGYIGLLDEAAHKVDPNSPLAKGLDGLLATTTKLVEQEKLHVSATVGLQTIGLLKSNQPIVPNSDVGKILHTLGIRGYATGGEVPGPIGRAQLAVVHGGERVLTRAQQHTSNPVVVNQHNHFHGSTPTMVDLEYVNRELGYRLSIAGRN